MTESTDVSTSEIWIKGKAEDGKPLSACFLPEKGMNFIHFQKGNIEAIDQSTLPLFQERFAGLGAMIGPHFHHRNADLIPPIKHEERFPHLAAVKARGTKDPFSHGIGRYAPWRVESVNENSIRAILRGEDKWNEIPLKGLEGQNFVMKYGAKIIPSGLEITLSVVSDTGSIVGLHTYYALAQGQGKVTAKVGNQYNDQGTWKPIPSSWNYADHTLTYELNQETDFGFCPYLRPYPASILMETATHKLQVQYWSENEENSWQLWHPKDASFVCIEPLSAKDPRKPHLTVSNIKILISIHDEK